jgi:hypothetical protein
MKNHPRKVLVISKAASKTPQLADRRPNWKRTLRHPLEN